MISTLRTPYNNTKFKFVHSYMASVKELGLPTFLTPPNLTQLKQERERRVKVRKRMTVKGTGGETHKAERIVATLVMSGFVSAPY